MKKSMGLYFFFLFSVSIFLFFVNRKRRETKKKVKPFFALKLCLCFYRCKLHRRVTVGVERRRSCEQSSRTFRRISIGGRVRCRNDCDRAGEYCHIFLLLFDVIRVDRCFFGDPNGVERDDQSDGDIVA